MRFHEARDLANDRDKLKLALKTITTEITLGEPGEFGLSWEQYDSDKWELIPAEPEVLTAGDMFTHMNECPTDGHYDCLAYGEAMHQNGRLERDIELRPLFINLGRLFDFVNHNRPIAVCELIDLIRATESIMSNLPPLNKNG